MVFITLALLSAALTLLYSYYYHMYSYWERWGVPHEKPWPLLGSMLGIGTKRHFRDVNQRIYGRFKGKTPFAGIFMFLKRTAVILDPELIKMVLIKDFNVFHDRLLFNNVRDDPLTGHLLTLEGEEWRSMRNKMTPVFTSGKMKHMFSIVVQVGQRLANAMDAAVNDNDVELKELCARYTTDGIGSCAFGLECNSLSNPLAEFRVKGRMLFDRPRHSQLVQAFIFTNPKLARKLRFKLLPDDLAEFFMDAVRNTVDYRLKQGIKRNDFLDQLIELRAQNVQAGTAHGQGIDLNQGLTIEQMAAQCFVFFVAGFETSSSIMAFCLYELALQPEVQQRLRQEIEVVLKNAGDVLSYDAMQQMSYLEQVLAETLRKYPIIPHLLRVTTQNYLVPGTGLVIEQDTTVLIPVHAMHHDPEIYPDPERFDPTRFEAESIKARHPFTYLPFGDGPRNCIGLRFGKMQAKIGLISLLRRFMFAISKRTEVPLIMSKKVFTLSSQHGIHLKVERI